MGAAVRINLNLIAAEDITASGRRSLCHQSVGDHNGIIRPLGHKVIIQRRRGGMIAVADDFSVHGTDAVGSTYQTVGPVVEGGHAVVHMGHGAGTMGVSHDSLFISCCGVSDAYNNTM